MNYKKNIRRIFWVYSVLFLILAVWIVKFVFFDAKYIIANPYNQRINLADTRIARGDITDANGLVTATTKQANGLNVRLYPYGREFAHPFGFSGYNSQGLEGLYAAELLTVNGEISQRIKNLATGEFVRGNTIITTLDAALQQKAYELLDGHRGAVIAIEPSTGKILACVSSPSFDPNRVAIEWDSLKSDRENNPLINRAAQGLYPPGSVFKIITATAAMRHVPDYKNFTYVCTGRETFDGKTLRCFNENAHGEVDYKSAFAKSCNTYFATLGYMVGAENLHAVSEELLFNKDLPYPLEYAKSSFVFDINSPLTEMAETAIGQGKTLTSPLHTAMLVSAIANDGRLMKPYIIDSIQSASGKTLKKYLPKTAKNIFSPEESAFLTEIMSAVVTEGTATRLSDIKQGVAGKTGSAETASGADHGWFAAFAPVDYPEIAVVVMLENSGGSTAATVVAGELIRFALSQ